MARLERVLAARTALSTAFRVGRYGMPSRIFAVAPDLPQIADLRAPSRSTSNRSCLMSRPVTNLEFTRHDENDRDDCKADRGRF
jgi:hypothetical protein